MTLAAMDTTTLLSLALGILAICISIWTGQNAKRGAELANANANRANEISKDANAIAKQAFDAATGLHVLLSLECRTSNYSGPQAIPVLTLVNRSAFLVAIETCYISVGGRDQPAEWVTVSHHSTSVPFELASGRRAFVEWSSSWINDQRQDLTGPATLTVWTESRHRFEVNPEDVRRVLDEAIAERHR